MARLQDTIKAIAASAREVVGASSEISGGSTDLSQRTEEQAASLEQTSASMEEISATAKKNAENAQQANQFATGTREVADRGGAVVAQVVSAMARIEESARKISDIISVIDEISRQTNSSGQVQEDVELVNPAPRSPRSWNRSSGWRRRLRDRLCQREQSTGIDQVNGALTQMDEVTQQNSALVEQNAAAALAAAPELAPMSRKYINLSSISSSYDPSKLLRESGRIGR